MNNRSSRNPLQQQLDSFLANYRDRNQTQLPANRTQPDLPSSGSNNLIRTHADNISMRIFGFPVPLAGDLEEIEHYITSSQSSFTQQSLHRVNLYSGSQANTGLYDQFSQQVVSCLARFPMLLFPLLFEYPILFPKGFESLEYPSISDGLISQAFAFSTLFRIITNSATRNYNPNHRNCNQTPIQYYRIIYFQMRNFESTPLPISMCVFTMSSLVYAILSDAYQTHYLANLPRGSNYRTVTPLTVLTTLNSILESNEHRGYNSYIREYLLGTHRPSHAHSINYYAFAEQEEARFSRLEYPDWLFRNCHRACIYYHVYVGNIQTANPDHVISTIMSFVVSTRQ